MRSGIKIGSGGSFSTIPNELIISGAGTDSSGKGYLLSGPIIVVFAQNRSSFSANDIYTGFIALEAFYTILDMVGRRSSEPHVNGLEKRPRNAFVSRVTMSRPVFRAKSVIIFVQAFRIC